MGADGLRTGLAPAQRVLPDMTMSGENDRHGTLSDESHFGLRPLSPFSGASDASCRYRLLVSSCPTN
jgi:hypothetical protein